MRVAIIAPPYPLSEAPTPPLGVSYVASAFEEAGAEVKVMDYIVNRYTSEKLKRELSEFQPDFVGATSVTMNFPVAADIIKTAKKNNPNIITMMGGPHVSFNVFNTLNEHPEIDLLVLGEGERTIGELVDSFIGNKKWSDIKGIAFHQNGEIVTTKPRELINDLDELPLPSRHLLPLSRYQALGFPVTMITSRGCPYACIFCLGWRMVGNKARHRKASLVVDEIEQILSYGFARINIADDLFTNDKEKVTDICEEIKRRKLKFSWTAFSRVNKVDMETLHLMRETGCDCLSFGIESGNQAMLKRIRKGITLDHARNAVKLCKEAGIVVHASFMVGLPGESQETLKDTSVFAEELDILYGYHFLAPFPGTSVRENIEKYDLKIMTDDWSRYDANSAIVRTSKLSPEDINQFVAKYDTEVEKRWKKYIQGYEDKTNSPDINLLVEGHFKMNLVFLILSEDLLDDCGSFSMGGLMEEVDDTISCLCQRIKAATGLDLEHINRTIRSFIEAGYIKYRKENNKLTWYWTHNNKVDFYGIKK